MDPFKSAGGAPIADPKARGEKRAAMLENWSDEPASEDAWGLMWYRCESCNHEERVWNARPHVTPFGGIPCPQCEGSMNHEHYGSDIHDSEHFPKKGDLIFIDTPPEIALIYARRLIRNYANQPGLPDPPTPKRLALKSLATFDGHSPYCLRLIS